ncbi:hypothetical protein PLESTF_000929600 [Pleodorina starrii]|nr:hypothetical protein PLESTF_000929600 [Pleodorina starrii]
MPDSKESVAAQVHAIVKECKEQVESKVEALIENARQRVQTLRADAEAQISRLPKQVRQMSAAEFFALTPAEAKASIMYHVLPRLQVLHQSNGDPKAVEAAGLVTSSLAALAAAAAPPQAHAAASVGPSGPVREEQEKRQDEELHQAEQRGAVREQPVDDQQPVEQGQQKTVHQQLPPQPQPCSKANPQASAGSPNKLAIASLMPPPPPRLPLASANPPVRQPLASEMVLYSANGSPVHLGQLIAPATTAKGMIPSLTDATPAAGTSCAGVVPQTMGFTGRTFRRVAPTRGRTKQPTRSITVTTQDGKQFAVDDLIGLAGVPEAYRDEVRRLMEADHQDLSALIQSVVTIEQNIAQANASANSGASASVPASNARPVRRR